MIAPWLADRRHCAVTPERNPRSTYALRLGLPKLPPGQADRLAGGAARATVAVNIPSPMVVKPL